MSQNYLTAVKTQTSERLLAEEFSSIDCVITLRRVKGPHATELFFSCKPTGQIKDAGEQANAMYRYLQELLKAENGTLGSIVAETIFMGDMDSDINAVRQVRKSIVDKSNSRTVEPALTEVQQPPLDASAAVEIAVQAIIPHTSPLDMHQLYAKSGCKCGECIESTGTVIRMGEETRLLSGGLCGDGDTAYEQTHSMFELAEKLLHAAGMEFTDVVRTWFYLREMERDYYPGLNKARREYFDSRGIDPVPASTGIEGGMVNSKHDLCMGFYAVKSGEPLMRTVMTTPTLNEAGEYGADFTRGIKIVEANKIALHVSGTASIDEGGKTAHVGNIEAQIDRMILNISTLLENQGADFGDIVSAYNYLKDPADEQLLKDKFRQAGLDGIPSVFVHAEVCRPDLLCETEVLAVLPCAPVSLGGQKHHHLRQAKPVSLK